MKLLTNFCTLLIAALMFNPATAVAQADVDFDTFFVDRTMRVDYFHTGGLGTEVFAQDQIVSDGDWAGSTTRLIDDLNLGKRGKFAALNH